MKKCILKTFDLTAGYSSNPIVNHANVNLNTGEFVGLVGRNGSGKSTLLLGIAGYIWRKTGKVHLLERDITNLIPFKRSRLGLGLMLQRESVFPELSVEANASFTVGKRTIDSIFTNSSLLNMEFNSILERKNEQAGSLSGGERRLFSLGLILANNPIAFLVDEPTLGLSTELEIEVMNFLKHYALTGGKSVFVVSHNIDLIEKLCDRIYVIERGFIQVEIKTGQLEKPLREYLIS